MSSCSQRSVSAWGAWGAWGPYYYTEYQREVGVLIRDRQSNQALYETHARYTSSWTSEAVLPALFEGLGGISDGLGASSPAPALPLATDAPSDEKAPWD